MININHDHWPLKNTKGASVYKWSSLRLYLSFPQVQVVLIWVKSKSETTSKSDTLTEQEFKSKYFFQ